MKRLHLIFSLLSLILLTSCQLPGLSLGGVNARPAEFVQAVKTPPPLDRAAPDIDGARQAMQDAIQLHVDQQLIYLMGETRLEGLAASYDGEWTAAEMVAYDPTSNQPFPTEPGLAIARQIDGAWQAALPGDPQWLEWVQQAPVELVSDDAKQLWLGMWSMAQNERTAIQAIGGYLLPWRGGETRVLTQGPVHDRYTPSGTAHYSFDFAAPGYPSQMFEITAARAGYVHIWRDQYPNGNTSYGNYIVLRDPSTDPVTYQLYLHLAQYSIPSALKSAGAPVAQGQLIGVADDTGVSTGNHLHFQVHTNPASYWGQSVDITFNDVDINGGRPRISADAPYCDWQGDVCTQFRSNYVSANYGGNPPPPPPPPPDSTPPQGGLTAPSLGATATSGVLHMTGWSTDNSDTAAVQIQARWGDAWVPVGPVFPLGSFAYDWDLCAAGVPDGPVSLALKVSDEAGNTTPALNGLRHFTKNFTCPATPVECTPGADQVALFSDPNLSGTCVKLGVGDYNVYTKLNPVGGDNAESIQVGANVQATLFADSYFTGRAETFTAADRNLADNHVGSNLVTSVKVQARGAAPAAPVLLWPPSSVTLNDINSITLAWTDGGGSLEYNAELYKGTALLKTRGWSASQSWDVGSLEAGAYTWKITARSGSQTAQANRSFTLGAISLAGASVSAPYSDNMQNSASRWTASSNFDLSNEFAHQDDVSWGYDANAANGYDTGAANAGQLTSRPIAIPGGATHYLRFYSLSETESPGLHWDRRLVQIATGDGPFETVYQLSDDPALYWLLSPAISLADYSGQTIRVRFVFETLDKTLNNYRGWWIDDFSISAEPPPACSDANNTPETATPLAYGTPFEGVICPGGDYDYFRFEGAAGDTVGAIVDAKSALPGSELDSYLSLLDADGRTVLAENDDQIAYERTDSAISLILPKAGIYYLKLNAWNHPEGDPLNTYRLRLYKDIADPTASFTNPFSGASIPADLVGLSVAASDSGVGVSHVEFLYHSGDWDKGGWQVLGSDWNPADGWNFAYDGSGLGASSGFAFYARVYDWAGNWVGTGAWNLNTFDQHHFLPMVRKR